MLFVGTSIIHPSTEGVFLLCNILDLLIYSLQNKSQESGQEKRQDLVKIFCPANLKPIPQTVSI